MTVLDRKLARDLKRLWAQSLAIALVMACGVMTIIIAMGAWRSLDETRSAFYDRYRFGSVFASVNRAPENLRTKITAISGVASVELRVVNPVLLDIDTMAEPATGLVVSLPNYGEPSVNRLYLRQGRYPDPRRVNEVAVIESFATAHGFKPGDSFKAIMNGRIRSLKITAIVLSPEYIYAIGPGDIVPDQKRFGIFYMTRAALDGLFDMDGAFNDLSLTTMRNADTGRIIETLDRLLESYGASGAYKRDKQVSHAFLDAELTSLQAMAKIIPPVFLFVSAFLVNMILSRLIALEREQIGLLKAVGYSGLSIGWHYAKLVIVISMIGVIIGAVAGWWLGRGLTQLYADFFFFPFLIFKNSPDLYLIAAIVTVVAALSGAVKTLYSITVLSPAVAMLPPVPPVYRQWFGGRQVLRERVSHLTIMSIRHLFRSPVRTGLTVLGTSLSVSLLITALFSYDAIDSMIDTVFFRADRQDMTLTFANDLSISSLDSVKQLPGVMRAEPFRSTTVEIINQHREKRMSLIGTDAGAKLSRVLDPQLNPIELTPVGIFLSARVAEILHLRPGDMLQVNLLEKKNRLVNVPLLGVTESLIGLTAYMRLDAMNRLMRDGSLISGARLSMDASKTERLYQTIKETPALAAIAIQGVSRAKFRETIEENITTMTAVYVVLAVIITFGVIYNSARIQLSERARELASLRVFGFTRSEVSGVLLTELAFIVLLAQPLGWLLGYFFSWSVVNGFDSDLYRIPLVINTSTYAVSSMVVLFAAIVSALIVRRRVDALNMVSVLKTRE